MTGSRRSPGKTARAKGLATVELAVLLPFLTLMAVATTDFGRIVHHYVALSNAVRAGAERGSMRNFTSHTQPSWEQQVQDAVLEELQENAHLSTNELEIEVFTTTDADGLFRVSVTGSLPFTTVVSWPGVPSQVVLNHRVEMRQIR